MVNTMLERTEQQQEELAFKRTDFAYEMSWERYLKGLKLKDFDFVDPDNYTRYFLMDIELVDYAVAIVSGLKGSGKSLMGTWLADTNKRLFGKGATLNYRPKEAFGAYNYMTEQTFLDEWVKLTELADREDSNEIINNLAALTSASQFYNRTIVIDEAKKWVWKRRSSSRMLGYVTELVDLTRHNHNVMLFACPNAENIVDRITIWEGRTHEIYCSFNTSFPGYATYQIVHRNTGKTRWLHLSAEKYSNLWESNNLIAMSRPITKKQMNEAQARARGNYKDITQGGN